VELRGEVRHEAVEDGLRGRGGLGCGCGGEGEEEGGAEEESGWKHSNTISFGILFGRW
jgi:hypothetical protein